MYLKNHTCDTKEETSIYGHSQILTFFEFFPVQHMFYSGIICIYKQPFPPYQGKQIVYYLYYKYSGFQRKKKHKKHYSPQRLSSHYIYNTKYIFYRRSLQRGLSKFIFTRQSHYILLCSKYFTV